MTNLKNPFIDFIKGRRYYLDERENILNEASRDFEEYLDTQYQRLKNSKCLVIFEPKLEDLEAYINRRYKK